jgi:hypothetical protein
LDLYRDNAVLPDYLKEKTMATENGQSVNGRGSDAQMSLPKADMGMYAMLEGAPAALMSLDRSHVGNCLSNAPNTCPSVLMI